LDQSGVYLHLALAVFIKRPQADVQIGAYMHGNLKFYRLSKRWAGTRYGRRPGEITTQQLCPIWSRLL